MKKKIIVELNEDNDVIFVSNEIYEHDPTPYMPSTFVKNEIINITEDNMTDIINHIIDNNGYTVFAEFVFKEKEQKLEIFCDKVLKDANMDFVLQKKKNNQYKSIVKTLNNRITLIDSEPNMYFKDYATVYDVLRIHKSLSDIEHIVAIIEKEFMAKLFRKRFRLNVKIDYFEYINGRSGYVVLTIGEIIFNITKDFSKVNIYGYNDFANEFFERVKVAMKEEWKQLFYFLDACREFLNYRGNDEVEIKNYKGNLYIKQDGIILTDNETFTINCNNKGELECFSSYYKEFSLLQKSSEEILKRSFIKISDCPKYLQEKLITLNNIKLEEKNRVKKKSI